MEIALWQWVYMWIWIAGLVVGIFFWKFAKKKGKESGNNSLSKVLIILGVFIGFTLIPGIAHIKGTNQYVPED